MVVPTVERTTGEALKLVPHIREVEPTSALDPISTAKTEDLMFELRLRMTRIRFHRWLDELRQQRKDGAAGC